METLTIEAARTTATARAATRTKMAVSRRRRLAAWLVASVILAIGPAGWALPRFPGEVANELQTNAVPGCKICHLEAKVAGFTAVTPFALSLKARGFEGEATLSAALAQSEADGVDTDGDGTSDVAELRAGTDPNSPFAGAPSGEDPTYGCALGDGPIEGDAPATWLSLMAAAVLLGARRAKSG